jgi:hypothetical protein
MARRIAVALTVVLGLLLAIAGHLAWRGGRIVAGYSAKILCSCVFVAGRDVASCEGEELASYQGLYAARIDRAAGAVETTALYLVGARARYREALGCTLE